MELKDWLNSINFTKENLLEDKSLSKEYPPFIINKCLSGEVDSVMYANEMNINYHLDNDMQYSFYLHSLRKRKRYSPWMKKHKIEDLEYIKKYYGYSNEKAAEAMKILTKAQIEWIKSKFETGGKN
jgi:hypothetical protein